MTMRLFSKTRVNLFHPISKKRFGEDSLEKTLEDWLETNPQLLGGNLFLIGRQVRTNHGIIDLLALDSKGNAVIIELKRGRASREVVGQLNSYLTIVNRWSEADLVRNANLVPYSRETNNLVKRFKEHFGCTDIPDFNSLQIGVVVAEEFEPDFVPQIGGLRFPCRVLQFSNFANNDGEEYLLINTLYDSADLEESEEAGRNDGTGSEYEKVPSATREKFFSLSDAVYEHLKKTSCSENDGWRLHKSGKYVQAVFSRWKNIYEGISLYYEPETGKKYIATNCLPKHNRGLSEEFRKHKKEIMANLGGELRWDISSWETISEYVGDSPSEIAKRVGLYVRVLRPYMDSALPSRNSLRVTGDITSVQLDYWKGLVDYSKVVGTKLSLRPPRAKGFILIGFEGQLLVGIASQNRIAVYLAIKGPNRNKIYTQLAKEQKSILKELGCAATFDSLPHRKESQVISNYEDGKLLDRGTWPDSYKWMLQTFDRYYAVFGPRLRAM